MTLFMILIIGDKTPINKDINKFLSMKLLIYVNT